MEIQVKNSRISKVNQKNLCKIFSILERFCILRVLFLTKKYYLFKFGRFKNNKCTILDSITVDFLVVSLIFVQVIKRMGKSSNKNGFLFDNI